MFPVAICPVAIYPGDDSIHCMNLQSRSDRYIEDIRMNLYE